MNDLFLPPCFFYVFKKQTDAEFGMSQELGHPYGFYLTISFPMSHLPWSMAGWTFGGILLCKYMIVYVCVQVHVYLHAHVCL